MVLLGGGGRGHRYSRTCGSISVPARVIGQTGGNRLRIAVDGQMAIDMAIDEARTVVVVGDRIGISARRVA